MQIGEACRRTDITATLHRSGLYGGVAKLKPLLSVDTWNTALEFAKKHLKDPQTVRNKILWSDDAQFQASCLKETSSAHLVQSTIPKVKCSGKQPHALGCFSEAEDWATHQSRKKAQCTKYWDGLNENPVQSTQNPRLCRRFTFQHDNEPKHTTRVAQPQPGIKPSQIFWRNLKMCI